MFTRLLQRWGVSTSSGSHFQVLDGLRGMAILMVVAFHTFYRNPEAGLFGWITTNLGEGGWMGVPIFFVLSGFLISYPFFQKRENDPQFWYQRGYARRRAGKILPPFYLSILLFIIFYWLQFHDPAYLDSAWKWALGLGNFIHVEPIFNGSYWSLIVESHFYFLLPLFFWLTRGQGVRLTSLFIFFVLFVGPMLARHFIWPEGIYVSPDNTEPVAKQLQVGLTRFPNQLDYFGWGVAFGGMYVSLGKLRESATALGLFGYAGLALLGWLMVFAVLWSKYFGIRAHPTRWSVETAHLLPALAAFLLLFLVFDPHCLGARILSASWLRFTGIISYEWFLFHGPIVQWFHQNNGSLHDPKLVYIWQTLTPFFLTFILSAMIYHYFSLPILRRVRDSLKS